MLILAEAELLLLLMLLLLLLLLFMLQLLLLLLLLFPPLLPVRVLLLRLLLQQQQLLLLLFLLLAASMSWILTPTSSGTTIRTREMAIAEKFGFTFSMPISRTPIIMNTGKVANASTVDAEVHIIDTSSVPWEIHVKMLDPCPPGDTDIIKAPALANAGMSKSGRRATITIGFSKHCPRRATATGLMLAKWNSFLRSICMPNAHMDINITARRSVCCNAASFMEFCSSALVKHKPYEYGPCGCADGQLHSLLVQFPTIICCVKVNQCTFGCSWALLVV
jgi:hypothetical protein